MDWLNKRWALSMWSRLVGMVAWSIFMILTMTVLEDKWSHALVQVALVILTFVFVIVIPDKIIFQEYLVNRTTQSKSKEKAL